MDALHTLWRARLSHLLSGIRNEDPTHRELANVQALIEQDYKERFAVELVQNANDQTVRQWKSAPDGPRRPGTVKVVWKDDLLVVLNQGLPFQARGIKAVASLAVSDKADEDLVGNKGVGFKAVYQVTEQPEIYSGVDLGDGAEHCFTLPREWAAHPDHLDELLAVGEKLLLEEGGDIPLATLRRELLRSSPSRYPRRLPSSRLVDRRADFDSDFGGFATAVVLPLRKGVDEAVAKSLAKLHRSAACLLFLPGLNRIEVDISSGEREQAFVLCRSELRGGTLKELTTSRSAGELKESTDWWTLQDEVSGLHAAAADLGLESWADIDRAPIAVALPKPSTEGGPLGATGKVCMGLPTDQDTGLPIWVDGRFHGFLNRDRIKLDSTYNELVFEGVLGLCRRLLAALREGPTDWKRAAVLALESGKGLLQRAAFLEGGFGLGASVLARDGKTWREPEAVWIPNELDAQHPEVFGLLAEHHPGPEVLPDQLLMKNAPSVLQDLGVGEAAAGMWLQRRGAPLSPLEAIAKALPGSDVLWARLLDWAAAAWREEPEALSDQRFLPVAGGQRLAPADSVTLPRARDADILPERVARRMRFLDDRALELRSVGRALTQLAKKLTLLEWVDQPRLDKLLEVVAEALAEVVAQENHQADHEALELWGIAMRWLADPTIDTTRVKGLRLHVPVGSAEMPTWILATRAYLGSGWMQLEPDHEDRLQSAYATYRLIPWSQIASRWPDAEREAWAAALEVFGIGVLPRTRPFRLKSAPLGCYYTKLVLGTGSFPDPALQASWQAYLDWLVANVDTKWSHSRDHFIEPVEWLDGLDRKDAVQPILELALLNPESLPSLTTAVYGKGGRGEARTAPSFWVHHLRKLALFPSRGAYRPASSIWHVPSSEESRYWTEPVQAIDRSFARSSRLLQALGVHTPEDAPVERLIGGLHELAKRISNDAGLGRTRGAQSLAIVLYEQLAERSRSPAANLAQLGTAPIPLVRGRGLMAVDLGVGEAFVLVRDDDQKARLVAGDYYELPYRRRSPPQHFVDRLVAGLGRTRVKRASQVEVVTGFVASTESEPLLPWLKHVAPRVDIELHLAALLTFSLPRRTQEVPSAAFTESLSKARVATGHFAGTGLVAFFDAGKDELQVENVEPAQVIRELWRVVGRAYMDVLVGYAGRLRTGADEYVLERCGLGELDLTDLEEGLGRLGVQQHAAVLVLARAEARGETIHAAAEAWRPISGVDRLLEWIGLDAEPDWLGPLRDQGLPEGVLIALEALGLSVRDWQAARVALGGEKYRFPSTLLAWADARDANAAAIRLACARDEALDLEAAAAAVEEFEGTPCPQELAESPDIDDFKAALQVAREALRLPPPSRRAGADHYRDAGEAERSRLALRFVELRLGEAAESCPDHDPHPIESDKRLGQLRRGPWAHWRVALYRLGQLLKAGNWTCYDEMQRANAFRAPPKEPEPPQEDDPPLLDDSPPTDGPVDLPPPNPPRDAPPAPRPPPPKQPGGGGGGPRTPSPRTAQRIGDRGELFLYRQLRALYVEEGRELDPGVWVSTARRRVGGLPGGDDDRGYDFQVRDINGRIAGLGESLLWIEVKTTTRGERRFAMSESEWAQAQHCADGSTGATYVIVRIQDDGAAGLRITDIVVDPVGQLDELQLRKDPKDHWITLGEPTGPR